MSIDPQTTFFTPNPSTLANMESFVADLKKQVQCSLCTDTLTEPKILPCFDVFCKPCIKRHAELIDQVNVFKCPRCKSRTPLPEQNSVEDLEPDLLHSRILKGLALVEGEKGCSVSDSHTTASWYCFDCDHSLCQECRNYHSFFAKEHRVVCLGDVKKEDIEFMITRENPCTNHPHQRMESFCEDCHDMICVTCLKHDHKGHKTMSLDKFASIKKAILSKHLKVVEQLRASNKEKQRQEKIANTIKQQGEKAKQEVKDKTRKIIEMLQEKKRELLRQIDEKLDTVTTNLNIIHHIPAVKEYIENIVEKGLASEMMDIKEKQCSHKFIFNHIPFSRVEFVPNEQLVQQVKSGLGEIRTSLTTDPKQSTIEVESETEALKKEKLTLIPKSSRGELHHEPRDVIDIQIKPQENVKIEKKQVRSDGKVEVEFMAKVAGQLTAEVQVNGNPVSNRPLVVNVKPQEMRARRFDLKGVGIGLSDMMGIAVNRDNSRIAVAYFFSQCFHVFTSDGDLLLTFGIQGRGKRQLNGPLGLTFLNDTDLVIADHGNHRIIIVNTTPGTVVKIFGKQGNGNGEFCYPCGVHVDEDHGNIIVCDSGNRRVQVFTRDGDYQYQFGLPTQDTFYPIDVITHDGLFYVSDIANHSIHVFEKKGNIPTRISTIGCDGNADGQLSSPCGLAIDSDHHLLVCDYNNDRVQKFTLDGRFVGKTRDIKNTPRFITVRKDGQILVSTCGSDVWCVQ